MPRGRFQGYRDEFLVVAPPRPEAEVVDPSQIGLFDADHDGVTYEPELDKLRLNCQQRRIFEVMRDGRYRSLRAIAELTGDPEASVSARLRDFRKEKFGGHGVERRRGENGLHHYQLNLKTRKENV